MFTPPPSPRPKMKRNDSDNPQTPVLESGTKNLPPLVDSKRRMGRRTCWAVIVVPLVLVLITGSTRYLMHPAAFDLFVQGPGSLSLHEMASQGLAWQPHKRHEQPERRQVSQSSSSPSSSSSSSSTPATTTTASSTAAANTPIPTIPSSPPTLPTPFPQPYDSDLTQNFSSVSCFNFFSNMTSTLPFRSCRPLSLLMDSSNAFTNAQTNLTLMNSIIWGTCNTTIAADQCISNMNWFAGALQTACVQDLKDQNAMAVGALQDLRSYSLVRTTGCLTNPTANTYCYVNAVWNSNPSDLYFYGLPLGISVPNNTTPLCSACTRSLMGAYYSALSDPTQASLLTGLSETYNDAANLAIAQCGTGYAEVTTSNGAAETLLRGHLWWSGLAVLLLCVVLQTIP